MHEHPQEDQNQNICTHQLVLVNLPSAFNPSTTPAGSAQASRSGQPFAGEWVPCSGAPWSFPLSHCLCTMAAAAAGGQSRTNGCVRGDFAKNHFDAKKKRKVNQSADVPVENILRALASTEILRISHFHLMQQAQMTTFSGSMWSGGFLQRPAAAAPPLALAHQSALCARR